MLLNEFFGNHTLKSPRENNDSLDSDDIFWFIANHNKLHKDHAPSIVKEIKSHGDLNDEQVLKTFMPMVNKGCKEYYERKKLLGKLGKIFPKKLREELCQQLYNYFHDDVVKNKYNLG